MRFFQSVCAAFIGGAITGLICTVIYLDRFGLMDSLGDLGLVWGPIIGGAGAFVLNIVIYPFFRRFDGFKVFLVLFVLGFTTCLGSAFTTSYESGPVPMLTSGTVAVLLGALTYYCFARVLNLSSKCSVGGSGS